MRRLTLIFGALLGALGVGAYATSEHKHVTTLIPAFIGLPLLLIGAVGGPDEGNKEPAAVASAFSLLGLLVSLQGLFLPQLFHSTAEHPEEYPRRRAVQAGTATLCGAYLGAAAKSLAMLADGTINADFMITHRFPFEKAADAFEMVANYRDGVIKAMIEF